MPSLDREIEQEIYDLRRYGGEGDTYAGGFTDACHQCADRLEAILRVHIRRHGKWDSAIVEALTLAARPLQARELTELVIGPQPNKQWQAVQGALADACRRGVMVRIGHSARTYRYELPPAVDAGDPALAARGTDAGPRA